MTGKEFDTILAHMQRVGRKASKTHEAARSVLVDGASKNGAARAFGANLGSVWRAIKTIENYRVCKHCGVVSAKR